MTSDIPSLASPKPGQAVPNTALLSRLSLNDAPPARILVVDDQPANIQIVGSALGALGHEIIPASDGATALKRLALRPPDLILLDLLMPGMDGCEVCRQLKENPDWKDIPVIFLSAADDKDLIVRALEAGGVDYITKPFNQAELISRVRTQLALKSARDQLKQLAEDKDELLGMLAHDLKNYLGGMNMSAELLQEGIDRFKDERLAQLSENILRSSAQLLAFVKEFLANAATDHGFTPEPHRPQPGRRGAGASSNSIRKPRGGKKSKSRPISRPANPLCSRTSPRSIRFWTICCPTPSSFRRPASRCIVSVRPAERQVECVVRDEGPGFTAEDKARMFRRYGRLSARPTGGEPSTGLGLSIVRKLVQAMNGELSCESSPGQGAAFTIRLPQPAST